MAASGKVIDGRATQVQVIPPPQSDAGLPTDEVPGSLKAIPSRQQEQVQTALKEKPPKRGPWGLLGSGGFRRLRYSGGCGVNLRGDEAAINRAYRILTRVGGI